MSIMLLSWITAANNSAFTGFWLIEKLHSIKERLGCLQLSPFLTSSHLRLNENTCDFILFVSVWASSCFAPFLHHRLHLNLFHSVTCLQWFYHCFVFYSTIWSFHFKKKEMVTLEDRGELPASPSATWRLCHILHRLQHQETSFSSLCLQDSVHAQHEFIKTICINNHLLDENVEIKTVLGFSLLFWHMYYQKEHGDSSEWVDVSCCFC